MFKKKSNKANKAKQQKPIFKQDYFNNCHRTYSCIHCRAHLANHDELISKLFQGNHGRAYLFNKVVNVGCKQAVQRELLTGLHAVADIYCDNCETTLGWKYEQAFVPSQKYKEGKYIIELVHMLKENDWDLTSYNTRELLDEIKISNFKLTSENSLSPRTKKELKKTRINNNFDGHYKEEFNNNSFLVDANRTNNNNDTIILTLRQVSQQQSVNNSDKQLMIDNNNSIELKEISKESLPSINGGNSIQINNIFLNGKNLEDVNAAEMSAQILSDGIELIEKSINKMQLMEDNLSMKISSYITTSKSNLSLIDNSFTEKTLENEDSTKCSSNFSNNINNDTEVSIVDNSCSNYVFANDVVDVVGKENISKQKSHNNDSQKMVPELELFQNVNTATTTKNEKEFN